VNRLLLIKIIISHVIVSDSEALFFLHLNHNKNHYLCKDDPPLLMSGMASIFLTKILYLLILLSILISNIYIFNSLL